MDIFLIKIMKEFFFLREKFLFKKKDYKDSFKKKENSSLYEVGKNCRKCDLFREISCMRSPVQVRAQWSGQK